MDDEERNYFLDLLEELEAEAFYGNVTFKYRAGSIHTIVQEKSMLPPRKTNGHAHHEERGHVPPPPIPRPNPELEHIA